MSDTVTVLNPGVAGDSMDESLVTQSDGVTQAKRPRVVPGGDDGKLQSFETDGARVRGNVRDSEVVNLLTEILFEMKIQSAALKLVIGHLNQTEDVTFEEMLEMREG